MSVVCEFDYAREDPDLPGYSLHELDLFTRQTVRFSLRKNLRTDDFEVYSHDYQTEQDTVKFHGDLVSTLVFSNSLIEQIFQGDAWRDTICDHARHADGELEIVP